MIAVIDASAALGLILAPANYRLLKAALRDADVVLAPELYIVGTVNAAWRYRRAAILSHSEASRLLADCLELPDEYTDLAESAMDSFELACQHNLSAYDMTYLALARKRGASLLTTDRKLARLAESVGVPVPPLS